MVLGLSQVLLQKPGHQVEELVQFIIRHFFYERFHQPIIGKFLQIIDYRVFICLTVEAKTDKTIVIFNKIMRVALFHFFTSLETVCDI